MGDAEPPARNGTASFFSTPCFFPGFLKSRKWLMKRQQECGRWSDPTSLGSRNCGKHCTTWKGLSGSRVTQLLCGRDSSLSIMSKLSAWMISLLFHTNHTTTTTALILIPNGASGHWRTVHNTLDLHSTFFF
jgi:hypothetical protein